MPDDVKRFLTIPVAVPVWSLVVVIAGLIYTAGMTMQKLDYVIASTSKIETIQQRVMDTQIVDSNQTVKIEANTKRLDKLESTIGEDHAQAKIR